MKAFFIDGKQKSLADIIIENKVNGSECLVMSYGFGINQINKLIANFKNVILITDISHSQLNKSLYNRAVKMSKIMQNFTFKPTRTHSKLAVVDNKIIIFTSANLSQNHRIESYLIGELYEIEGIEEIKKAFYCPDKVLEKKENNFDFNLDFELNNIEINL